MPSCAVRLCGALGQYWLDTLLVPSFQYKIKSSILDLELCLSRYSCFWLHKWFSNMHHTCWSLADVNPTLYTNDLYDEFNPVQKFIMWDFCVVRHRLRMLLAVLGGINFLLFWSVCVVVISVWTVIIIVYGDLHKWWILCAEKSGTKSKNLHYHQSLRAHHVIFVCLITICWNHQQAWSCLQQVGMCVCKLMFSIRCGCMI